MVIFHRGYLLHLLHLEPEAHLRPPETLTFRSFRSFRSRVEATMVRAAWHRRASAAMESVESMGSVGSTWSSVRRQGSTESTGAPNSAPELRMRVPPSGGARRRRRGRRGLRGRRGGSAGSGGSGGSVSRGLKGASVMADGEISDVKN